MICNTSSENPNYSDGWKIQFRIPKISKNTPPSLLLKEKLDIHFHKPILNFRHLTFQLDKYILKSILHIISAVTASVGKQSTHLPLAGLKPSDLFSWAGPHSEG